MKVKKVFKVGCLSILFIFISIIVLAIMCGNPSSTLTNKANRVKEAYTVANQANDVVKVIIGSDFDELLEAASRTGEYESSSYDSAINVDVIPTIENAFLKYVDCLPDYNSTIPYEDNYETLEKLIAAYRCAMPYCTSAEELDKMLSHVRTRMTLILADNPNSYTVSSFDYLSELDIRKKELASGNLFNSHLMGNAYVLRTMLYK